MEILKIEYDTAIPEVKVASKLFWRKYVMKRTVMFSLVFAITAMLFGMMMFGGATTRTMFGAIGTGLSLGLLANLWLKPRRVLKKLVEVLEMSPEEQYSAGFRDNEIEVETIIKAAEGVEAQESLVQTSIYQLDTEELCSMETRELFLLYVNRALIHVFPKRCLSEQQANELRDYFTLKKI